MGNEIDRVTAEVLLESTSGSKEGLRRHALNALKASCRNARDAVVAVVLYDDEGKVLGLDVTGTPSEEMQREIDALLGEQDTS